MDFSKTECLEIFFITYLVNSLKYCEVLQYWLSLLHCRESITLLGGGGGNNIDIFQDIPIVFMAAIL